MSSGNENDAGNDSNAEAEDHQNTMHTWVFEPATSDRNTKSLTDEGVDKIAAHKYKAGVYTALDNLLNPIWAGLTELLPMWLAPNMVTTFGALHCATAYFVTWYYSWNFDVTVPDWVVALSGYCMIVYYTLDCMDGKQARRTGQSSPLGQLFDHGFDCLCNLCHVSTQAGYLLVGGSWWFFGLQGSLFFAFFMAQWEEYYTGSLPHSMGNFGVSEVNYFLGCFAIWNSLIDREQFWTSLLKDSLPEAVSGYVPTFLLGMEIRHVGLASWCSTSIILISGSFYRVLNHEFVIKNNLKFSAVSKLVTPFLIVVAPFALPKHIIETETRLLSIVVGLLMSFLTIKIICFSMAKQSFASIQMEAVPYWAVIGLTITDASNHDLFNTHVVKVLLGGLCLWYAYRLVDWSRMAIRQICNKLDIYCFTIKNKKKTE